MNAVQQTRKMMTLLNEKLGSELERLEEAFKNKDLQLLNEATKQLNLYAQRGYDLTVSSNDYARFKRTSRQEFFEIIQADFEANGIEIVFPSKDGYSGEAIYFKAFGERLAVLYGEHQSLTGEVGKGNTEFLHYTLEGHKERYQLEMDKIADFDKRIRVIQRLLDNPELILTEEFASERKESHQMGRILFHNLNLQKVYEKFFSRFADRQAGKRLMMEIQTPETRERMTERMASIQIQKESHLKTMEQYEERIKALEEHEPQFEGVITSFFALVEKYNMPYTGKND